MGIHAHYIVSVRQKGADYNPNRSNQNLFVEVKVIWNLCLHPPKPRSAGQNPGLIVRIRQSYKVAILLEESFAPTRF